MSRSLLRFALVVALLLLLTAPAFAGGVAVTLDKPPDDLQAGVAFTIGFTIKSAHGDNTPQTGLTPVIKAASLATDEQVTATGKAEGAAGHYVATLTFPSAGKWQWRIQPFGDAEYTLTLPGPLEVRAKGAPAKAPKLAPSQAVDAKAQDDSFDPREMTVAAGTTVTWHMMGNHPHTVTATDGTFASGNLDSGKSFSFTFTTPGTYQYYCEYHGNKDGQGMAGTVFVTAAPVAAVQPAQLPKTAGTVDTPIGALLIALLAGALGLALWRRSGRSLR